jgi:hyperosmotically inducible periplasmic protein
MNKNLLAAGLAATLSLGAAAIVRADTNDAWLTTKTKIVLLTTEGVPGTAVNVDTVDGRVTLHGKVATGEEKAKAEAAARTVDGVKDVKNLLQVVPESQRKIVNATDDQVKDNVDRALKGDKTIEDVKVASVNKGVVLLSGKTKSLDAKLKAIERAADVPGVKHVSSEIEANEK